MKFIKQISLLLIALLMLSFCSCQKVDKNYGVEDEVVSSDASSAKGTSLPEISSLDSKMSKYFDISLFDEENYADNYLGKKYEIKANFAGTDFSLPTTMADIYLQGWQLKAGSDYDENSLIYAKETIELVFENEDGASITALFYNSSNFSVRLSNCEIVKLRFGNNYYKNNKDFDEFNVNGVTNKSVITDVILTLGTPSHFYEKTKNSYYFDYFLHKRDRRNKIRIYVDLEDDAVTAVEVSKY